MVSGGPRRGGHTNAAAGRVLAGLARPGNQAGFVSLAEFPLRPCAAGCSCAKGCGCVIPGPNFDLLLPKFAQPDAVIPGLVPGNFQTRHVRQKISRL